MYKFGHYGISLLAYAPIAVALLLTDAADLAALGGAVVIALATLPDVDHRIPFVTHRGITHTVWFALLVGVALEAFVAVASTRLLGAGVAVVPAFGFAMGAFAVLAHLLGDVLTPAGIRPFWPLSRWHCTLNLTPAKNPIANYGLFALGVGVTASVLYALGVPG